MVIDLARDVAGQAAEPGLVAIRIDGLHPDDHLLMTGAVGIDVSGQKHPPDVVEGATENAATV